MSSRSDTFAAGVLNVIAGIWLVVSPWVLGFATNPTQTADMVVVGVVVAVLALIRVTSATAYWVVWVNALAGACLFISPWVLRFTGDRTQFWNALIVGAIVVILSVWAGVASPRSRRGVPVGR